MIGEVAAAKQREQNAEWECLMQDARAKGCTLSVWVQAAKHSRGVRDKALPPEGQETAQPAEREEQSALRAAERSGKKGASNGIIICVSDARKSYCRFGLTQPVRLWQGDVNTICWATPWEVRVAIRDVGHQTSPRLGIDG